MTISNNDIKLLASQRLTDNPDGGGRMTGIEVVDGEVNNLFPDISRLDRTYGRVALRKAFAAVLTATRDVYYGAHTILTRPPADPQVGALLFSTDSHTDLRADARDRIESYVTMGPESDMYPYGDQLEGQRTISALQAVDGRLPEVGEVYVLDATDTGDQQYVRVTEVNHEVRTFTVMSGGQMVDVDRRVLTIGIGNPLRYHFNGGAPSALSGRNGATAIRTTQVADASRYYGVSRLAVAISQGDLTAKVDSIYHPLVPATRGESPVVDVDVGQAVTEMTSGGRTFEIRAINQTGQKAISLANRAYNYTLSLDPKPARESLVVEYRALGKWYRLRDDGQGALTGDGTGSVDYNTGSVIVTLDALPDVETALVYHWGTPVHYVDRADGSVSVDQPLITGQLSQEGVVAGSITATWLSGGATKTATDDGRGNFTGDATGRIIYGLGVYALEPTIPPDPNSLVQFDYQAGAPTTSTHNPTKDGSGFVTVQLPDAPIKPGSITLQWVVTREAEYFHYQQDSGVRSRSNSQYYGAGLAREWTTQENYAWASADEDSSSRLLHYSIQDDGAGGLAGMTDAVVDYTAGTVTFRPEREYSYRRWGETAGATQDWQERSTSDSWADGGTIIARSQADSLTGAAASESVEPPAVAFDIAPLVRDHIVPGTLRFTWGTTQYEDNGDGGMYYTAADGTRYYAGSIDYAGRLVALTDYVPATGAPTIDTLVTAYGSWTMWQATFRTPGAPLQPGGLTLQATDVNGELLTAESDFNGAISGTYARGKLDPDTGLVSVEFGELVEAAGNENEWWYDADAVDAQGMIWKPREVYPDTVRYNAVIYTVLPLDADLLGLDPVRLPSDGRVPTFRPGDVVVVHNDQQETLPQPLSAGQQVVLAYQELAACALVDSAGTAVDASLYTVDLAGGTVTMADALDLTGYSEPLIAEYRIEDMLLCSDVQINGTLTFTGAIDHDYPVAGTFVSAALIHGDLQARVANFFEQQSWDGTTWRDEVQGSTTTAQYNNTNYPVEVTNEGAIQERWALRFTSSTTFDVVGETVGVIGTGNITADCQPTNPNTNAPYFIVRASGWGSGWVAGNTVRFNTIGAQDPIWLARTTLSGKASQDADEFRIQIRGDAD